jgi:hypothetical protein
MMGFSRLFAMPSAIGLPTTVATPPGGKGMTMDIGLFGHVGSAITGPLKVGEIKNAETINNDLFEILFLIKRIA